MLAAESLSSGPSGDDVMAQIRALARPASSRAPIPALVDRPIVLDFRDHSFTVGYRLRHDERREMAGFPGFAGAAFATRTSRKELFAEYRRRVAHDFEVGLRVPYLGLKEARPTRINTLAGAPFFFTTEDVRNENGLGDLTFLVARAWNRPGLSRRLGLEIETDTARGSIPDTRSLPLGSGQMDYSLSYGIKETRGNFALTGSAGLQVRGAGSVTSFSGATVRVDPGDQFFLRLRGDRRIEGWLTASLEAEARASGRDAIAGVEVPGTTRELIALTPILTYQASPLFEIIADAQIPLHAEGVADTIRIGAAVRWRY